MTKISVIIPTYNEESNIQRVLDSVFFADEIIVIDSFSSDNTVEIVKKNNIILLQREFDDFSTQKNFAITYASHDWVLFIDADEVIPLALQKEISEAVLLQNDIVAYTMKRALYFNTQRVYFSGFKRGCVTRLFQKKYCEFNGKVHEIVVVNKGKVGEFKNRLLHFSFINYTQYKQKLEFYAKLQAAEYYQKGKRATISHLYAKPFIRFITQFIIKLGFLDGRKGYLLSKLHGYGVYRRYKELLQLQD